MIFFHKLWHLYHPIKHLFSLYMYTSNIFHVINESWPQIMFLNLNYSFYKGNSNAVIGTSARDSHRCSSSREGSPAGYSRLSLDCIKGCARNYRCRYGTYSLLWNNCHHFTNRLSAVLCTTGTTCPSWCLGSCNHTEAG